MHSVIWLATVCKSSVGQCFCAVQWACRGTPRTSSHAVVVVCCLVKQVQSSAVVGQSLNPGIQLDLIMHVMSLRVDPGRDACLDCHWLQLSHHPGRTARTSQVQRELLVEHIMAHALGLVCVMLACGCCVCKIQIVVPTATSSA